VDRECLQEASCPVNEEEKRDYNDSRGLGVVHCTMMPERE
jgi:hypothetical protein